MSTTSARDKHGTRYDQGTQRTLWLLKSNASHVSKSKNLHVPAVKAMPLSSPWRSWRPCVISRFTASLMPLLSLCSPPVKNNNHNNNLPQLTTSTSVTLLLLFKPSAIKRPPTSVKSFLLCITRRHTRCQPQHQVAFTSALHACTLHMCPPLPHMPLLTKLIVFRRLNRPRLAHSG